MKQFSDLQNQSNAYQNKNIGNWKFSKNLNIFDNAHAVLVLTEWDVYKNINWIDVAKKMVRPSWVFDARSIVNRDLIKKTGINMWSLGDGSANDEIGNF